MSCTCTRVSLQARAGEQCSNYRQTLCYNLYTKHILVFVPFFGFSSCSVAMYMQYYSKQ